MRPTQRQRSAHGVNERDPNGAVDAIIRYAVTFHASGLRVFYASCPLRW
jgi:hypothetical protein